MRPLKKSIQVGQTQCPRCSSRGLDTRKDNLKIYSDGHRHCYACGYHTSGNSYQAAKASTLKEEEEEDIMLPKDSSSVIGREGLNWLQSYGLSQKNIKDTALQWSENKKLLIQPLYGSKGGLIGYVARNFMGKGPKYINRGNIKDPCIYTTETINTGEVIVFVEDFVSALKVSYSYDSCPLFSTNISNAKLSDAITDYATAVVWLDPDAEKQAYEIASKLSSLGIEVGIIFSEKDPKCYDVQQIKEMIDAVVSDND